MCLDYTLEPIEQQVNQVIASKIGDDYYQVNTQEAIVKSMSTCAMSKIQTLEDYSDGTLYWLLKVVNGQYNNFRKHAVVVKIEVKISCKVLIEKAKQALRIASAPAPVQNPIGGLSQQGNIVITSSSNGKVDRSAQLCAENQVWRLATTWEIGNFVESLHKIWRCQDVNCPNYHNYCWLTITRPGQHFKINYSDIES